MRHSAVRKLRARSLIRYPLAATAASTLLRVGSRTLVWPLRTRDTVATDTPAFCATSEIEISSAVRNESVICFNSQPAGCNGLHYWSETGRGAIRTNTNEGVPTNT